VVTLDGDLTCTQINSDTQPPSNALAWCRNWPLTLMKQYGRKWELSQEPFFSTTPCVMGTALP
jgi:hypothetical protein